MSMALNKKFSECYKETLTQILSVVHELLFCMSANWYLIKQQHLDDVAYLCVIICLEKALNTLEETVSFIKNF